ncbi:MAG: hypothetical protein ACRDZ5_11600, partial [Acidimicrobiales bacterium]
MTVRSTLDGILCDLQGVVADLDPESFRGEEAEHVLERFSKIERVAAAGKALCARRCVETNRHKAEGARNPGEWLGRKTGETQGRCLGGLETAEKLDGLVELDRQFRSGDLSVSQAREIAAAASLDPSSEAALLDLARRGSLKELRNEAERIKARARSKEEEAARQRRLHDSRYLRTWTGGDGAFLGSFSLTPTDGARLMAALQPAYDEIFASARRSGAHERPEAYMADALVAAVTGEITLEAGEEPLVPGSDTAAREGPVSSSGRGGKDNASPETTRSDLDPGVAGTDAGLGTSAGKDTGDPSPAGTRKPWVRHLG